MAYAENYNLTKVYKTNYIAKYMEVYDEVYNQMKTKFDDEQALQAAVATVMIAFSKAAGMDMPGIVTWDESEAVSDEDFKTFVVPKPKADYSGGYKSNYSKPAGQPQGGQSDAPVKKQYTGPTSNLAGKISQPQVDKLNEYIHDKNQKVSDIVTNALKELDVDIEELSKQEAFDIIGACMAEKKKSGGYSKRY